jgi:hypothetical protein
MSTFKFAALNTDGSRTEGRLDAESTSDAIRKVKELGLFPVKITSAPNEAADTPSTSTPSADSNSTSSPDSNELQRCDAFGQKVRLRKFLVFYLPFGVVAGIVFYLLCVGKPFWLLAIISVAALLGFGIAGMVVEQNMLNTFVCPRCGTALEDWNTNAQYRIFYDCRQCRIKWDIGYALHRGNVK